MSGAVASDFTKRENGRPMKKLKSNLFHWPRKWPFVKPLTRLQSHKLLIDTC